MTWFLTGNSKDYFGKLIQKLRIEFALKDLGKLVYFIGLEIKHFSGYFYKPNQVHKRLVSSCKDARMLTFGYLNGYESYCRPSLIAPQGIQ